MDAFLTFDYELFFGNPTGSVEKCLLYPTNRLLEISKKYQVPMTFFVDIGYIIALEKQKNDFPELAVDYSKIRTQLTEIKQVGCSIALHIHPHWERSYYTKNGWQIHTKNAYKLSDFSEEERTDIIFRYSAKLSEIAGEKMTVFRAGGWCIQPFELLEQQFQSLGIQLDSSVFPGGKMDTGEYAFNFTNAPKKSKYRFQSDVCQEVESGFFTEVPISSHLYSPLFYWRLYAWGRIQPKMHKMIGDGIFMSQPGRKKQVLTHFTWNHASSDGFYASKLKKITRQKIRQNDENLVVIGHPKSCTEYSLLKLEQYVQQFSTKIKFKNLNEVAC